MTSPTTRALAFVLALPLAAMPALAQDAGTESPPAETVQLDAPVVSVGEVVITMGDVMAALDALPPEMRDRAPQDQIIPSLVNQLVLRELVLREARATGLDEDPAVVAMAEAPGLSVEDAIVRTYVTRELDAVAEDEAAVQALYDQVAESSGRELPPLEQVRPQVVRTLQQERLAEIQTELSEGVEITLYDAEGEPRVADEAGDTAPPVATGGAGTDGTGAQDGSEPVGSTSPLNALGTAPDETGSDADAPGAEAASEQMPEADGMPGEDAGTLETDTETPADAAEADGD